MKKLLIYIITINTLIFAEISEQEAAQLELRAAEIRKELGIRTLTPEEKKLARIRAELHLDFDTTSKDALLQNNKPKTVASLVTLEKKSMIDSLSNLGEKLGLSQKNDTQNSNSISATINALYHSVGLEEGEYWGMPSVFGVNEKKSSAPLGLEFLDDLQESGKFMYKSMKYSGTSAEFTSGMMYRSSKIYNTMFGIFEDSPFNVFEDEEKTSVFDVFEGGNKVLDIFD